MCVSSGPQYGTLELAWSALCTEAEKVSELHMEVKAALMGEDFEKLKNWQRDGFHKQMIGGFKETKEAEDCFRKAQKPWAKKLKEVGSVHLYVCSSTHSSVYLPVCLSTRLSVHPSVVTPHQWWLLGPWLS